MPFRVAVVLTVAFSLAGAAVARELPPTGKPAAASRGEKEQPALSPARERQKRCGIEWRGLSAADKTAKGPTWPKFYSKCVKRLKQPKD